MKTSYSEWAAEVVRLMEVAKRVRNPDGLEPVDLLDICRGDEPMGAWEEGESPTDYVGSLLDFDPRDGDTGWLDPTVEL